MKEPWVIFRLASQRYCTAATDIREIITYRQASPIPGAPPGVEGIIKVRKDKITLFSGGYLVEGKPIGDRDRHNEGQQEDGHIILLESNDALFGVSVDGVDGIVELDPKDIDRGTATRDEAVLGTVPHPQEKRGQGAERHDGSQHSALLTALDLVRFCEGAVTEHDL